MRLVIPILALAATLVAVRPQGEAAAANAAARQYYSNGKTVGRWHYYPQQKAFGMYYKYKPTANYAGYKYHMAYYYPSRPKYVYYYNPDTKKYWGRCPLNPTRQNPYQILDYPDRREKLDDIPEDKFQPLPRDLTDPETGNKKKFTGPMPPIPGSDDDEPMEPPPPPPSE